MGFIGWLAVDAALVAVMTVKILEWATVKAIYYQPQPRTNDLLLTNWLKSWGGYPQPKYKKQGIRPRSYYQHKTKRRYANIGHKIPHQTMHHLPIIIATAAKTITKD